MPEMTVAELIALMEALAAEPSQLLRGQSGQHLKGGGGAATATPATAGLASAVLGARSCADTAASGRSIPAVRSRARNAERRAATGRTRMSGMPRVGGRMSISGSPPHRPGRHPRRYTRPPVVTQRIAETLTRRGLPRLARVIQHDPERPVVLAGAGAGHGGAVCAPIG